MALTTDQLQAVEHHLRKENWLLNQDLITELTDHYIAGIEDRMSTGMPFQTALDALHTGFGGRKGLLNLEEKFEEKPVISLFPEFMATLLSYAKPPRLFFSLLLAVFSYWISQENIIATWGKPLYLTLSGISITIFLCVAGNLPLLGQPKFVTPAVLHAYRMSYPLHFTLIFNGVLYGTSIKSDFVHYSLGLQTALCFGYLLIWVVVIEFTSRILFRSNLIVR